MSVVVATRYIVGAGAQGRVVLDIWRAQHPEADFLFLDDDLALQGTDISGVRVAGGTQLVGRDPAHSETVLALGNNRLRLELGATWTVRGVLWGLPIHPSAVISPSAILGRGTVVAAAAVVGTQARVGQQVVVNTGAIVEHDCVIEDGASLSPGVRMGGRVVVEQGAFLAVGVTLVPRVRVGAGAIVGAGSVVVRDLPAGMLAYGIPARVVRPVTESDWKRVL